MNLTRNYGKTINWFDYDNRDSYKLCLEHYGLKALKATPIDEITVELTVHGPIDNLKAFLEDFENGSCEPLDSMSRSLEFDDDYEGWLNNEIYAFDQLAEFEPKA